MRISDWSSDVCSSDLYQGHGGIDVKGFGQIVERPLLKGRYRTVQIGKRRHDDDRQIGVALLDAMQKTQAVLAGHAHVSQQYRRRGAVQGFERLGGRSETLSGHGSRSEEHTSELQSLMRISYSVFCL